MNDDTSADPTHIAITQEHIEVMADALLDVCTVLNIPEERPHDRDLLADRIIDLAESGVLDAKELCERVIAEVKITRYRG